VRETPPARADIQSAARHYIWPQLTRAEVEAGVPQVLTAGAGVRVQTADGTEYLDLMSTVSRASALGYGEERIASALRHADVPTRSEMERLAAQVHGLSVQVNNLVEELRKK